jgi:hypothetical protein
VWCQNLPKNANKPSRSFEERTRDLIFTNIPGIK